MLVAQRRQQRSGAIALPSSVGIGGGGGGSGGGGGGGGASGRLQRFLRRFTRAPSTLLGQVRRRSAAVLGGGHSSEDEASQLELTLYARRPRTVSLASLVQRTRFTSQELKAIYRRFKSECPYGLMNEEVLDRILAQIFPLGNAHTFAHFVFCCFDRGRTGCVTFEQFALCLNTLLKGSREERLRWIFNMYDVNKDGEINRRELLEIVGSVFDLLGNRVRPPVTPSTVEDHATVVFRRLDVDGDGVISWEDFRAYFDSNPGLLSGMDALQTLFA